MLGPAFGMTNYNVLESKVHGVAARNPDNPGTLQLLERSRLTGMVSMP